MTSPPATPVDVIDPSSGEPPDDSAPGNGDHLAPRRRQIHWTLGHPDGIVTGLSASLAQRLMIDPLWVRLAFVGSALLGGIGLFVYVGLWLAVIVGGSSVVRWIGGAIAVVGFVAPVQSGVSFMTGPVAVIGLLVGLGLALWKPAPEWDRSGESDRPTAADDPVRPIWDSPNSDGGATRTDVRNDRPRRVVRHVRPARPVSVLGRATLGCATIVAAGGALIDELNGGRLHPEQWLGAAGVACGVGLLVGAVRGHARWLIVPAAVLAVGGYGAGLMARVGVGPGDAFGGNEYVWVGDGSTGPYRAVGGLDPPQISIQQVPAEPVTIDVRTISGVNLTVIPDVTVEIRSRLGEVTMDRDATRERASTFTLGPAGTPDVVIDLRMARGTIRVWDQPVFDDSLESGPVVPAFPELIGSDGSPAGPIVEVADGIAVTSDGWIILDGEAIIDAGGAVILGNAYTPDETTLFINTSRGEYRLIGPVLFTPDGSYVDVNEIRQRVLTPDVDPVAQTIDTTIETVPTVETVPDELVEPNDDAPGSPLITIDPLIGGDE